MLGIVGVKILKSLIPQKLKNWFKKLNV